MFHFPLFEISGMLTSMEIAEDEFVIFRYLAPYGMAMKWEQPSELSHAINSAFRVCPSPETVQIGLPLGMQIPLCGNPEFRKIATSLIKRVPGLVFFVLGGASPICREIFLACLPNLESAADDNDNILVRYPIDEARGFIFGQLLAMRDAGISDSEAKRELRYLATQCGLDSFLRL